MEFRGKYDFLSNMYPCKVHDDYGIEYSCVEAAFQAHKTEELGERRRISRMSGPDAKRAGRKVNLISGWDEKKVDVMRKLLTEKFADPDLMAKLTAIQEDIVEDNTWNDKYWGCYKGKGKNVLGQLLMEIRDAANTPKLSEQQHSATPGRIVISSVARIKTAMQNVPNLDEAWFVVRSLKTLCGNLPDLKTVKSFWVNQLSPSDGLFATYWNMKQQGNWNHEAFMNIYVPQFLEEMKTDYAKSYLNTLYHNVKNEGKTIALVCFCKEEAECHRSILAGLMQGVGITVVNEEGNEVDYSLYNDMYRGKVSAQPESQQAPAEEPRPVIIEQEKPQVPDTPAEKPKFYMLVAGSRTFHNAITMENVLNHLLSAKVQTHDIIIIEGGARGADILAREYAKNHNYEFKEFPAQWVVNGQRDKAAGFKRNRVMHEFLKDKPERGCVCFWDGTSTGTADNFKLCKEFNTPLRVFDFEQNQFIN